MSDIIEMKRMLADRAQEVCEYICPDGERKQHEWAYDPGHGKIKVELRGGKAGVWSHFGGDGGGDLIDLWRYMRGTSMRDTLKEVRNYLGIEETEPHRTAAKNWNRPVPPRTDLKPEVSDVTEYLTGTRKIPQAWLDTYDIGALPSGRAMAFKYKLNDTDVRLVKIRTLDGKSIPTEANCEPILFGWHTVPDACRVIAIVEGELDAPSAMALGMHVPTLSVPFGGGSGQKQQWVEHDWERLEQMEKFYLMLDNDKEGDIGCEEIAKRLGRHKCVRVRLPRKDANACLMEGLSIDDAVEEAEEMKPGGIRLVASYEQEVHDLFDPPPNTHLGYSSPFTRMHGKLLFRPGEVTVWSGDTGSGKSQILSYHAAWWVKEGSGVVIASLEMAPNQTLRRMVRQCCDMNAPSKVFITECFEFLSESPAGGRVLIYDQVGKDSLKVILDSFSYCMRKYGADMFIIDSLMRLGIETDDYNGQEAAMFELTNWAVVNRVHVHLVAHNRKRPAGHNGGQGTDGIKGAMEVAANAFNHIEIWRRRDVEETLSKEAAGMPLSPKEQDKVDLPSVSLAVNKQRNGDFEGRMGLWFDQDSYRYWEEKGGPYGIGNNPYF